MKLEEFVAQLPHLYRKLTSTARYLRCRDVEDVVQQTLEETLRQVERLVGDVLPYAKRILLRKISKAWKQPVWLPLIDAATGEAIEVAVLPGQETAVLTRTLGNMIGALPPKFRAALLLVEVEGYSVKDAAAALGLPLGTVKSRLHRAKAMVKVQLMGQQQGRRHPVESSRHEAAMAGAPPMRGHCRPVRNGQPQEVAADQMPKEPDIHRFTDDTLNPTLWKMLQRYLRIAEGRLPRAILGLPPDILKGKQ